jgi:hypothetical protein
MPTTITTETTRNVKTIQEAHDLVEAAFTQHGDSLKSVTVFVWSDKSVAIEVKVSAIASTQE